MLIACHNAAEAERLGEVFSDTAMSQGGSALHSRWDGFDRDFMRSTRDTLVLSDHELFDRTEVPRPSIRRRYEGRAIDSFLDLNEGDLVVHLHHGIAYYRGLQLVDRDAEHGEEQLVLEFAGQTKLYVPIAQIDLVQKYVGGGRGTPALSQDRLECLGAQEEAGGRGSGRPGFRATGDPGKASEPAGICLSGDQHPLAAGV